MWISTFPFCNCYQIPQLNCKLKRYDMTWYGIHVRYDIYVITCLFNTFAFIHIVRLTMRHHLFLKFWLVDTWFFADWRHHRAVTRLESVRQSNIRRGKKLGVQLSHKHPLFIDSSTIVPAWTPQLNQLTAIIAFEGHFKNLNLSLPVSPSLSHSLSLSLFLSLFCQHLIKKWKNSYPSAFN